MYSHYKNNLYSKYQKIQFTLVDHFVVILFYFNIFFFSSSFRQLLMLQTVLYKKLLIT